MLNRFTYKRRHLQFLRENAHKKPAQVVDDFNQHFGTNVPKSSIINVRKNHGISSTKTPVNLQRRAQA